MTWETNQPESSGFGPSRGGGQLASVEEALGRREAEARQTAATERRIGLIVLIIAFSAIVVLVGVSATSLFGTTGAPGSPPFFDRQSGIEGIILEAAGIGPIIWASLILFRSPASRVKVDNRAAVGATAVEAITRIDEATEELDRARATASRCQNAVVIAAAIVTVRVWFLPGYYSAGSGAASVVVSVASDLAIPLALGLVLWTAHRLERTEGLQLELRRWVRGVARLERAFWDRF
jgi:hypothetical protein